MPLLLGPSIAVALGCIIALGLGADVGFSPRLRATLFYFAGGVVIPVFAYVAFRHPAWSLGYLVDDAHLPSALLLVLCLVVAGGVVAATAYFHGWVARGRARDVLLVLAVALVGSVALTVGLRARFAVVASYRGFRGHVEGTSLWASPLGLTVIVALGVLGTGAWLVARSALADDETPPLEPEVRRPRLAPRGRRLGRDP